MHAHDRRPGTTRRALLLLVAAAMTAAAALAIGILLLGDFGGTEGRILLSTVLLALHGALATPAAVLVDQRRRLSLAAACAAVVSVSAALNVVGVWWSSDSETFGKVIGTVMFVAIPTVAAAALATRPLHRLFVPSLAAAYLTAALAVGALWTETEQEAYFRVVGALAVLSVLLIALQPVLLRATRSRVTVPLRVVDDEGRSSDTFAEGATFADAARNAIRAAERQGRHVRSVETIGR